jgi:hypothetical protein
LIVIDEIVSNVIGCIRDQIVRRQQIDRDAVSRARASQCASWRRRLPRRMRTSRRVLHRLERVKDDPPKFARPLSEMLDEQRMYQNYHESGV